MKNLISSISIDLLLHFEAIARLQSLKLAANELGLSPSAITQSLKQLEEKLDATLCVRGRSKFSLTETGQTIFSSASKIKDELSHLSSELSNDPSSFNGLFSIGIIDNFSSPKYNEIISLIVKTFPNIKLAIQAIDPDEMLNWLKSGDLDLGFGIFYNKDASLSYHQIGEENLYYYASKKHPLYKKKNVKIKDLYNNNLMWYGSTLKTRSELKHDIFSHKDSFKMDLKAYTNSQSGALDIIDSGFAIAPFSEGYTNKQRRNLNIKVKTPKLISYMIHNPNISRNPVLNHIINNI